MRRWCEDCCAEREDWHRHGDPLEQLTWEELLVIARLPATTVLPEPKRSSLSPGVPKC